MHVVPSQLQVKDGHHNGHFSVWLPVKNYLQELFCHLSWRTLPRCSDHTICPQRHRNTAAVSVTGGVLKVFVLAQTRSSSRHSYKFGDVTYRVAYVGEMIASEAFCHISRSFHISIGSTNARIGLFLAKNIRSESSHLIWAKIGSDQMRPFRSDVSFFLPSTWNLPLILQVWPAPCIHCNTLSKTPPPP